MSKVIALLDSGVNEGHPHIRDHGNVIHGPFLDDSGQWVDDPEPGDLLGHGTCAAAAILDLAPGHTILSLRIFRDQPRCPFDRLLSTLAYCIERQVDWINLSLGTTRPSRVPELEKILEKAAERNVRVVAPAAIGDLPCYPGALDGCEGVLVDSERSRDQPTRDATANVWFASPQPRDLPGLPSSSNLSGVSLSAANLTGYLASRS
ncbi:MAG: S8 family serine peptidase [Planctomycetota bacterium]